MTPRLAVGLAEVTVAVPDPDSTAAFLGEALGMPRERTDGAFRMGAAGIPGLLGPGPVLHLMEGPATALRGMEWRLRAAIDPEEAAAVLRTRTIPVSDDGAALSLTDPDGVNLTLRREAVSAGLAAPHAPQCPRRLGHVNLAVPDAAASASFYTDVLGFALSERVGDRLTFLRTSPDHHNLGFRSGAPQAQLHHIALEVAGWHSFLDICDRVADMGHTVEYGPGRHSPGNNLFVYLRDPSSGLRLELFADMYQIADEDGFEPHTWDGRARPQTVNRWGPQPPESFMA